MVKENRSSIKGTTLDLQDFKVSVHLRVNKPQANGRYPVQVYVYYKKTGQKMEYNIKFDLETAEFVALFSKEKALLRKPQRELRDKIDLIITKLCDDLTSKDQFVFSEFKERIKSKGRTNKDVNYHFQKRIDHFKELNSIGNASWYDCALKSLESFNKFNNKTKLEFHEITANWLQKYEQYMIKAGRSKTTISMYLRALRAVFNHLMKEGILESSVYPFKNFSIKEGAKVKKALGLDDIKRLYQAEPLSEEQEKAKAFWFFSYFSNGMNIKDIIHLKWNQFESNKFSFERIKTAGTNKVAKIIEVYLNDYHRQIISKYGKPGNKDEYVFDVLNSDDSPEVVHNKTKRFTRYINQHMKKFAASVGVTSLISSYYARHSFATNIIRQGRSLEFAQEALGHSSFKTTQNYFAGFEDDAKKEAAIQIYNELINI